MAARSSVSPSQDGPLRHDVQDVDQDVVQRAEERVEQDAPGQRAHDLGNDVRQQDEAAQHRAPASGRLCSSSAAANAEYELEDLGPER